VYQGKTRFEVQHANGDIFVDRDNLTINVYNSSQPDGVLVTYTRGDKTGVTVNVLPGQSLAANLVNGIMQAQVNKLTQSAIDTFAEPGVPTSAQQVQNSAINKAKSVLHLPF
jgi:hypothetical protein